MTLNILVSFSLLALVVTARPLKDAPQSVRRSLEVQNAVQALFASRTGQSPDCLACEEEDDVHISLTTFEEQSALLSDLQDLDAVKAVIPLNIDGAPSEDEQELYEILKSLKSTGSLEDIDGDVRPLPEDAASVVATDAASEGDGTSSEDASQEPLEVPFAEMYTSPPIIVLAVSCIAALLAVLVVGAGLYAYNRFNTIMIKSGLAWDVLPQLERRVALDNSHDDNDTRGGAPLPEKRRFLLDAPLPPVNVFDEKLADGLNEKVVLVDVNEPLSDDEDLDEKFHDAPEHSLLFSDSEHPPQYEPQLDIPRIIVEEHADPDLLPLPGISSDQSTPFSTPLRTPLRTPLATPTRSRSPEMREMQSSPTLSSKPLWSVRAAEAPVLGLSGTASSSRSDPPVPQLPGALFPDEAPEMQQINRPRTRTPRQPLDIAFALQLRPGLGLGADPAWLVRFLMAMFGYLTFFIGGPKREEVRRSLTASA